MSDHRSNIETETFKRRALLRQLRGEHRQLDETIVQLQAEPYVDELQLRRLKKQKLKLKDLIALTESELIPDLDA